MRFTKTWFFIFTMNTLAGCGGFVYEKQLSGSYWIVAVDSPESVIVCRKLVGSDCVGDELPGPRVFAAGANGRYVTIARHPAAEGAPPDMSVTEYFYVIRHRDDEPLHDGDVVGPLNKAEFDAAKDRLELPAIFRATNERD
jgi:hypothetical protein